MEANFYVIVEVATGAKVLEACEGVLPPVTISDHARKGLRNWDLMSPTVEAAFTLPVMVMEGKNRGLQKTTFRY